MFAPETIAFFTIVDKELIPLCIQLEEGGEWFDPLAENEFGWLVAKMIHNNVDVLDHESRAHLGLTHLIQETISVGLNKYLKEEHWLRKLLAPHLIHTILINEGARLSLIAKGGTFDDIFSVGRLGCFFAVESGYRNLDWENNLGLVDNLESRGMLSKDFPISFPYRDDALVVHEALTKMVSRVVDNHYADDAAVVADSQLKEFAGGIAKVTNVGGTAIPADPFNEADATKGSATRFPPRFTSKKQVAKVAVNIMFNGSVQHNAVNSPQMDNFSFAPNAPSLLRGKDAKGSLPKSQKTVTANDIAYALPYGQAALSQLSTVALLVTENPLVLMENGHYVEKDYVKDLYDFQHTKDDLACTEYQQDLFRAQTTLGMYNALRTKDYTAKGHLAPVPPTVHYPYLAPSLVNFSVQI